MERKEVLAMLLAGGQGSRLGVLTENNAKPAVSFGGKYRIIDFSLSNCVNSAIDTVGVLTQYRPTILNRYIGTGDSWDLDVQGGGVHILPPYATQDGGQWYSGTADAIFHNIDFIDSYNPKYVLILSGDHLYKMNYRLMLEDHIKNNADLTVSVMEVPWDEASRFGIMSTDDTNRITRFAEKPAEPESNLASMGIYIFTWEVLRKSLIEDSQIADSEHDFGKNIIPTLLSEGKNLFAYHFSGYWKDIGTIDSYYAANMDMMHPERGFNIFDKSFRIFSNSNMYPPHHIGPDAKVEDSLVCNGCLVRGEVIRSIMSSVSVVSEGSVVEDSILLPHASVGKNCHIVNTIVSEGVVIKDNSNIGTKDGEITVIGAHSEFAENEEGGRA